MALTLKEAIDTAQTILNDDGVTYTREDLLRYGNDALDAMLLLAPHLFHETGELACVDGETIQAVSFDDAHALVSVIRVKGGRALTQFDKSAMDRFSPGWHQSEPAPARGWCPDDTGNPMRFYIWPPAPADQVLEVIFVRLPREYGETEDTGLPATYVAAVSDYIVATANARDDEHVLSNRATVFFNKFAAHFGGGAKA